MPGNAASPRDGYWPIHRAAWGRTPRHLEAVEILLSIDTGACRAETPDGETPLAKAKLPAIRALLEACASPREERGERAPEEPGSVP